MEFLKVENLCKVYGKGESRVTALDHVSLTIEKGEFTAIIGTSGSGKSTLLHIIGGVDVPTSGAVYLDGQDVYAQNNEALAIFRRRQVGLIYQFHNLIPTLNVVENITLPILMDRREVNQERLDELLELLGLSDRKNHLPNQLSGGQQQRVSIGRALMNAPAVMLADEPTGNVILVQFHPKERPVILQSLSTRISFITDRHKVRCSSRVKASYMVLKSCCSRRSTAAKSGGGSAAGSGICRRAAE